MNSQELPAVTAEEKAVVAMMVGLDADIVAGSIGYATNMRIVKAFGAVGLELSKPERERIWGALKNKRYFFDEKQSRIVDYAATVAAALWNGYRGGLGELPGGMLESSLFVEFKIYTLEEGQW